MPTTFNDFRMSLVFLVNPSQQTPKIYIMFLAFGLQHSTQPIVERILTQPFRSINIYNTMPKFRLFFVLCVHFNNGHQALF
jgi:hypothetical protein